MDVRLFRLSFKVAIMLLTLVCFAACTPVNLNLNLLVTSPTPLAPVERAIIPITGLNATETTIPATDTITPTPVPSATSTPQPPTATATFTPSPSPTATQTQVPTATSAPTLPSSVVISGVRSWRQLLSLDCESAAATQWAAFLGHTFSELAFQKQLPVSDNPDFGFVGNVNGPWGLIPPYGYGVYANPVAALLNAYGVQAHAYKGFTLEELKATLAKGIPVIAWVIGNAQPGTPVTYTDAEGRTTVVAADEHVVIVTGYTPTTIRYTTEGTNYTRSNQAFLNSWGVLGNMVVVR